MHDGRAGLSVRLGHRRGHAGTNGPDDLEILETATAFVPDGVIAELCDALGLIGTPEHCARRIADLTAAGVKSLYIMPLQTFVGPEQEIRAFRDAVFPKLKAAGYR